MKQSFIRVGATGALMASVAIGLAACGSSHATSNSAVTPSATVPTSSTPSPTAPMSADAATIAAVTKAYTTFFNAKKPPAQVMAALQNGPKLAAVLALAARSPTAAHISATVSKVVLVNPHLADVTFSLFSSGFAVLTNTSGKAVLVNGTWKVAAYTFCGLTTAENAGKVPPACAQPGMTALPSS